MSGTSVEERLRALMVGAAQGDAAAYHALLGALSTHLRGFFRRRLTRLPDEVEDLIQETLIAIHNQRHTYDPDQPFTSWVHAIAKYKLVDMLRRHGRHALLTDPLDDAMELTAVSDSEASDARRDLDGLLATLPDKQRLPIVHVKIEGLSVIETAQLTGLSVSAVKIGVHRGLKALAARIRGSA
ncbi:MAG TPA: sigma-70 family RNA polymerase sigma factor [Burkholderiaceae bacterium]|nr:sigma-70 family RNA polymerase sigma factor [Burkholderiaceae bacterium]